MQLVVNRTEEELQQNIIGEQEVAFACQFCNKRKIMKIKDIEKLVETCSKCPR